MAFRGIFDVPGQGQIPVYDFEREVPRSLLGKKVGIVEATASTDLLQRRNSVLTGSPPLGLFVVLAIVIIVVIGAVWITTLLTTTTVTETENGFIIQVPGATYFTDKDGNIISQQGKPTLDLLGEAIEDITNAVIVISVVAAGAFILFKFVLPALSKPKKVRA